MFASLTTRRACSLRRAALEPLGQCHLAHQVVRPGQQVGGWSLYVKDGKPTCTYNYFDQKRTSIVSAEKLAHGKATIVFDFAYEGGATPGKGGVGSTSVNGRKVGEGRLDATNCCMFSLDEGTDVGRDDGTPVTEDYKVPFAFTGTIRKVEVKLR